MFCTSLHKYPCGNPAGVSPEASLYHQWLIQQMFQWLAFQHGLNRLGSIGIHGGLPCPMWDAVEVTLDRCSSSLIMWAAFQSMSKHPDQR